MRRSLVVLVVVALSAVVVPTATQAADEGRFFDPRCDVYGYDYTTGERFDDRCSGIDFDEGLVDSTRRGILLFVSYRDLDPTNTEAASAYVLWLDTDQDDAPDWRLRFAAEGSFEELGRVTAWDDTSPELVRCAGLVTDVSLTEDSSRLVIPHECVRTGKTFRFNLQARNRYDGDLSWERDCYPEVRTWSLKQRHDT